MSNFLALKVLASAVSPSGKRACLSTLIFHRVLSVPDPIRPLEIDSTTFRWMVSVLASNFNVLPLSIAAQHLISGTLPDRAACITFDDGYADNVEVALPILSEFKLPATFFIAPGFLDGGRMWNDTVIEAVRCLPTGNLDLSHRNLGVHNIRSIDDRIELINFLLKKLKYLDPVQRDEEAFMIAEIAKATLADNLMMSTIQVQTLFESGMEIGAHTVNHPILSKINAGKARHEIAESKEMLQEIVGNKITLFAYPNGKPGQDYEQGHVEMVRGLGFTAAVSTAWGVGRAQSDIFQLPRFTPWDTTPRRFMMRLLWNCWHSGV